MATRRMIEMAARPDRNPVVGCLISDDATAIVPNRMVHPEPWEARRACGFIHQHASSVEQLRFIHEVLALAGRGHGMAHRHLFTALWWHFGPYGPQDVHVHSCARDEPGECYRVLIGQGRECDGETRSHERMTLTEDGPKRRAGTRGA